MGLSEQNTEYAALSDTDLVAAACNDLDAFGELIRRQAQVRSWLYRIATNLALNAVQRRREYPAETLPDQPARYDPASDAVNRALQEDISVAIADLPDKQYPVPCRGAGGISGCIL